MNENQQTQSTANSVPSTMENKTPPAVDRLPPIKSDNFLVTLLSLLLLLAVATAGFFAYQTQNLVKQINDLKSQPATTEKTNTPQPTNDPVADWKTYKSSTYTVKYPSDLEMNEQEGSILQLSKWGPTQQEGTEFYDGISISFQPREIDLTAKEYAEGKIEEVKKVGISTVEKGLEKVYVGDYQGYTFTVSELGTYKTIILKATNGMIMVINNATIDPGNLGYNKTVDQILSTFKFIEPEASGSPVACTMEAKICPDGSSVGRVGPTCEFAPCSD